LFLSALWILRVFLTRCVNAAFTGSSSAAHTQHVNELERRVRMSRKNGRRIRIRAVRRDPPDVRKLGKALLALAMAQAQAEADARAEHQEKAKEDRKNAA
jgi:hypothetical protein